MGNLTDEGWQLLHEIRLRGMVADPPEPATSELEKAGYGMRRKTMLVMTPAGREVHVAWARLPEGSDVEAVARRSYERFLELDGTVKALTTEWQMARSSSRPDGFDADTWKIVDRLVANHGRVLSVLRPLGEAAPRFAGYHPRLRAAIAKLEDGEADWFSGLKCDSYHCVWWQLHEDLLLALGISRADDPNQ